MSPYSPTEWTGCHRPDNGGYNPSNGRIPFAIFFTEPGKTLAQRTAFDGPVHPGGGDPTRPRSAAVSEPFNSYKNEEPRHMRVLRLDQGS